MSDLQNLLNEQMPEGWRPSEGDKVIGEVLRVVSGTSDYGNYPILVIADKDKNQNVAVHCFHYTLKKAILDKKPQIGETIGIKYEGQQPVQDSDRTVNVYNVEVEGRGADYSSFTPSNRGAGDTASSSGGQNSGDEGDDLPF